MTVNILTAMVAAYIVALGVWYITRINKPSTQEVHLSIIAVSMAGALVAYLFWNS